jgi:hypothetical protein
MTVSQGSAFQNFRAPTFYHLADKFMRFHTTGQVFDGAAFSEFPVDVESNLEVIRPSLGFVYTQHHVVYEVHRLAANPRIHFPIPRHGAVKGISLFENQTFPAVFHHGSIEIFEIVGRLFHN